MATRRRWLQFSLRGFLVVLTIGCLWLGYRVEKARWEIEAVKSIERLGGVVRYDWQPMIWFFDYGKGPLMGTELFAVGSTEKPQPDGPAWLRRLIGDEYFQSVDNVYLFVPESHIRRAIPALQSLPHLKNVFVGDWISDSTCEELKAGLPGRTLKFDHFDERLSVLLSNPETYADFVSMPLK